jgi:hypothetical protein
VNPTEESLDEELKEFQLRLEAILKEFLEQGRIEVYGNLYLPSPVFIGLEARRERHTQQSRTKMRLLRGC